MNPRIDANESWSANSWRWDLALSLLFLAVVLVTAPDDGTRARNFPISNGSEQTNIAPARAR